VAQALQQVGYGSAGRRLIAMRDGGEFERGVRSGGARGFPRRSSGGSGRAVLEHHGVWEVSSTNAVNIGTASGPHLNDSQCRHKGGHVGGDAACDGLASEVCLDVLARGGCIGGEEVSDKGRGSRGFRDVGYYLKWPELGVF
jgi:hypothetical protein